MSSARILLLPFLLSLCLPAWADTVPDAVRQKLLLPPGNLELLPVEAVKGEPRDAETASRTPSPRSRTISRHGRSLAMLRGPAESLPGS